MTSRQGSNPRPKIRILEFFQLNYERFWVSIQVRTETNCPTSNHATITLYTPVTQSGFEPLFTNPKFVVLPVRRKGCSEDRTRTCAFLLPKQAGNPLPYSAI